MFFAHSENSVRAKHILKDHLESTADLCLSFAQSAELEQLFFLAGLVYDVGKA